MEPAEWAMVSMALTAVSTVGSMVGSIQQGNAQAAASERNAAIARQNADMANAQAAADADTQHRNSEIRISDANANFGASGITAEGSPLDILAQSASQAERDRQTILYKGAVRAYGFNAEAGLDDMRASTAIMNGYLNAGGELLKGGATIASRWPSEGKPIVAADDPLRQGGPF